MKSVEVGPEVSEGVDQAVVECEGGEVGEEVGQVVEGDAGGIDCYCELFYVVEVAGAANAVDFGWVKCVSMYLVGLVWCFVDVRWFW